MNKPEFWASMTAAQTIPDQERTLAWWDVLVAAYQKWRPEESISRRVPRIVHQIWLGSPLPKLYARWGESWRRQNPGWDYRLWTEKEIADFGLRNQRSYDLSPNFGVKSDLARYEILERFGGVYADTDFECLVSFERLASSTDFFTGLMYGTNPVIANGLIGSRPGHPILKTLVRDLSEPFLGTDGMAILEYCGPGKFTRECISHLQGHPTDSMVVLPTTFFYAFPNRDIEMKDLKAARNWARPESLALHYWEVSWKDQSASSRVYWWMKKHLPRWLFRLIYRVVKGKFPD